MNEQDKDNAWTRGTTGKNAVSGTGFLYQPGANGQYEEMCPICVLLVDSDLSQKDRAKGTELFGKYMHISIQVQSDGKGNVTSRAGWYCSMCGASGEGETPAFHAKPKKEVDNGTYTTP